MISNRLVLNPSKTEILWAATSKRQNLLDLSSPLILSGGEIYPSKTVDLLGVRLGTDLSLSEQIDKSVSTSFFVLRQIKAIRRCLPSDALKSLINAFVLSRVDYCSAIYSRQTKKQFSRLQSVLNAAARLIFGLGKFCHITPILKNLHWLRFPERVYYRVCHMVYKALNGKAPVYLAELLSRQTNTSDLVLRSSVSGGVRLCEPQRQKPTCFGDRAFRNGAPAVWNGLPLDIRTASTESVFKKKLKTHLFQSSYPG
jgi:hypothetical protein